MKLQIGDTRGIFTLKEIINEKTGIFYCSVCDKEHTASLHSWYYRGRSRCGRLQTNHRLYDRYAKMIDRCHNKNSSKYMYYGGRGIRVCERWLTSFDNFLEDMEESFVEGYQLDRIDNDGNYEPNNCRWVSHSLNMQNRREFKNKTNFPGVKETSSGKFFGRVQKNKKKYKTKLYNTPEKAYKELQLLKQSL